MLRNLYVSSRLVLITTRWNKYRFCSYYTIEALRLRKVKKIPKDPLVSSMIETWIQDSSHFFTAPRSWSWLNHLWLLIFALFISTLSLRPVSFLYFYLFFLNLSFLLRHHSHHLYIGFHQLTTDLILLLWVTNLCLIYSSFKFPLD